MKYLFLGSLTLHHWQQLAKPHLATILDPHPGVVTKGFCPLPQDAVYRLSDMEEDEEDEQHGGTGVLEKGAAERGKDEEEEEEEAGITFKVRVSSTPDERRERKHTVSPLPVSPLSLTPPTLPEPPAASPSVTSVLSLTASPRPVTDKTSQSSQPIPGTCTTAVQSQSQICFSASTTASSSGKYYVKYCKVKRLLDCFSHKLCRPFSAKSRKVPELHFFHLHLHNLSHSAPQ